MVYFKALFQFAWIDSENLNQLRWPVSGTFKTSSSTNKMNNITARHNSFILLDYVIIAS
jgi:hypothetical protein